MPGIPPIPTYALPATGTLPSNVVDWRVEPSRAVLLIHDMQGYFLAPLPSVLRAELVENVAAVRKRCAAQQVPIAYTTHPGRMTEEERGLLRDFWGPGMQTTPADRDVVHGLAPAEGDWLFTKWRYSAFFRTNLLTRMRETRRDQLVLCGVYAHVGVLMSAVDAFTHDIRPFLVANGVADFSEAHHRQALEYAAQRCAKVLTAEEVFA
jgi:trans-2,3-dihydro-3-hydroxyanthranilic acid synthase